MTPSVESYRSQTKIAVFVASFCIIGFIASLLVETLTDLNGLTGMWLGGLWFIIFSIRIIWLKSRLRTLRANNPEVAADAPSNSG